MTSAIDSHDAVTADWATGLLDFWFNRIGEQGWWSHDPAVDRACADRFRDLWQEMRTREAADFLDRADEALAAILLFDQMPRNMFRGRAEAFATDSLARDIARGAVARGYDVQIGGAGRRFFYMPFMHSEAMADQDLSMTLFEGAGDPESLDFARKHRSIVARHGRFPNRNAALGRETQPEEAAALAESEDW
jgi:uncharacterized protein (DUF924 family)